ncbi:hypothetical protein K493DRAFT_315555 [Basidiobolus meristosporus CBS 931.73]|uniref:C2H2-type domain-containing protein n=1 Tax=Basidiobolus meristosporus CBS 931.73 TaxID=1314790 RepID=A0A1Y1Y990_9FUNG|nr:hypothetical protein K493DRAFT_315555 [Basidiobolus meristosporus CBS 931.73]|eukprot:ORX94306.1 hypothetical protein K493DRAFT_315555 [Basidiobolus meristosporus CBS 931.73]
MKTPTRSTYRRKPIHITCTVCRKSFNRKDNFMRHFRNHSGEFPHPCPHTDCGKGFTRRDQLLRHLNSKHCDQLGRQSSPHSDCGSASSEDSLLTLNDHPSMAFAKNILFCDKKDAIESTMSIGNLINNASCKAFQAKSRMRLSFLLN